MIFFLLLFFVSLSIFAQTTPNDVPASGVYFVTFEFLSELIKKYRQSESLGIFWSVIAGGISGIMFWIPAMPPDVLKSRLQTAPEGTFPKGIRSVFAELMKTEGPSALYRGVGTVMIRAFPANGACFFGIEVANQMFRRYFPDL